MGPTTPPARSGQGMSRRSWPSRAAIWRDGPQGGGGADSGAIGDDDTPRDALRGTRSRLKICGACPNLTVMNAEARGRVLVASNRGPVSFRLSDDGKLTSRRG